MRVHARLLRRSSEYRENRRRVEATSNINVAALRPQMMRTESTGDFYTLHHTMIHSVTAQPYTTSLIVRGPAVKDRFLVTDWR